MAEDNRGFASPNYPQEKAQKARRKGGQISSRKQDMSKLGQKGGQAAQQSGNAHRLTNEDRRKGGERSSQKQNMSELGRKGGSQ
ncbi:MAG TPA: hypothetical protein VM077_02185 [Candidatus Limnocylindrales bacterium]|nr:hypothetical protein [Candidatus Limnocylindrales bacterium]